MKMNKKTLRMVLLLSCVLVALVVALGIFASAEEGKVVYISANGTGDGSSASSPLGNDAGYSEQLANEIANMPSKVQSTLPTKNALYKAFVQIINSGKDGTIVIVGDVAIDSADWLTNSGFSYTYPKWKDNITVTVTSNYGGTDYRTTNNAKLILDRTKATSVNLLIGTKYAMKDLDIEYRYNNNITSPAKYEQDFMFLEYAGSFVADTGVNVISKNYTDPSNVVDGDRYPVVVGGRLSGSDGWIRGKSIVLKSGTWSNVIGGQHGDGTAAAVVSYSSITVDGAKVNNIYGVGSPKNTASSIEGYKTLDVPSVTISVLSGEVGAIYGNNGKGNLGTLKIDIAGKSKVGEVNYAYGTPTNVPTSTTLTYSRAAVSDANVKGFTGTNVTVTPIGLPEGQKVIYVSNTGAGLKDGSSPANAMGHDDGYANILANGTLDEQKQLYKKNVMYKALSDEELLEKGGYIVFVGETTVDVSSDMTTASMREFPWVKGTDKTSATGQKNITFTSIDPMNDNKDYRTEGAKFVLDVTRTCICLDFRTPQTWENVKIEHKYDSAVVKTSEKAGAFSGFGKKMVFGAGIEVVATDVNAANKAVYPSIIGAHRWENLTTNTDITVKSGTWGDVMGASFGTTSVGKITGNINVLVEGGKIGTLTGGTRPYVNWLDNIPVNGNISITVNGGEVTKIYGAGGAGLANASNTVTVTVGENAKVGSAYSYHFISESVNGTKKPTNSTINYNSDALATDKIYYFTTVNKTGGTAPLPPSTEPQTIYIASVAKGTGDGSTPANAMGNDAGYADVLASGTQDQKKQLYKKNAFYKAFTQLSACGGTIVVVDKMSIDVSENMYFSSLTELLMPVTKKEIKITSIDPSTGTDYRATGAKVVLDTHYTLLNIELRGATVWENLNIEYNYDSSLYSQMNVERFAMITCCGNKTVFGEGLTVTSVDTSAAPVVIYPTIVGGTRWNNTKNAGNFNLTIKSGTWGSVFGGNYGVGTNGNTSYSSTVTVEGGKIVDVLTGTTKNVNQAGTSVKLTGDVTITVNGGEVTKIIGANHNGLGAATNKVTVTIGENAKVGEAYSFDCFSGESNIANRPENSTITFAYKAIREDNVKYFTTKNPQGNPSDQPTLKENVYYIADVATGDGSGKDADNLMGHGAGYQAALASEDSATRLGAYKLNVLYRVLNETSLIAEGGKVVIAGVTTINSSDGMKLTDLAEFHWPKAGDKTITFTSVYDGVDYRTQGAKFVFDRRNTTILLEMQTPTVWENLTIEQIFNNKDGVDAQRAAGFAGNGNKTVFGEGIKCISTDVNAAPVECYPTIIGGHRWQNIQKSTDITIKSGTWGCVLGANWGTTAVGTHTGNVTILVEGGKIEYLTASNKNTETTSNAVINGNVNITVTGGEVSKITATNHNGLGNDSYSLNVVIGENAKVGKAWAFNFLGSNEAKQPKNSTITFASCAIREDQVKYFTNATMVGDPSLQPELEMYTLYIANEAKGTGDGSSPENAMGHDAGYYADLAKAIEISKIKVAERTTEQNEFCAALAKKHVLYKATNDKKLMSGGGKIVLVGEVTLDVTSSMRQDNMCEFPFARKADETITFTSVDKGVDYRTQGAKLVFDVRYTCINLDMNGPTVWENITIEHLYNSKTCSDAERAAMFSGNCYTTVFGEGIEVIATDVDSRNIKLYPTIIGGHRWSNLKRDSNIIIKSGTWGNVFGANFGTATVGNFTGNVNITVDGGTITILSGGNKNTNTSATPVLTGNVNITINGGVVRKLMGSHHNGLDGEGHQINVVINEGASVGKAWGFQYTDKMADKMPTAYITYASSAIRTDNIKYFTNATMVGDPSLQPEESYYTIYIADKPRGTGDGTSPENAMGNDSDYAALYKKVLQYIKIDEKKRTQEQKDLITSLYKKSALYKATQDPTLIALGGKIVVVGKLTIDSASDFRKSLVEFPLPGSSEEQLVITSKDNGVDYRKKGARITFDIRNTYTILVMNAPTLFEYVTIEHLYNSDNGAHVEATAMLAANGKPLEIGYGVYTYNTDVGAKPKENYISILGGHRWQNLKTNTSITIRSGTWGQVMGGNFGTATMGKLEGNVDILVTGGKISRICGTNKYHTTNHKETVTGNVRIRVWGGEVDIIYGTNNNGIKKGYVSVSIGKGAKVNQAYGYHPNYKGKAKVYAYIYYHTDAIAKNKIYNFIQATPQTSTSVVFFVGVAALAGAGAVAVGTKNKKRRIK